MKKIGAILISMFLYSQTNASDFSKWIDTLKKRNHLDDSKEKLEPATAKQITNRQEFFTTISSEIKSWKTNPSTLPNGEKFTENFSNSFDKLGLKIDDLTYATDEQGRTLLHIATEEAYGFAKSFSGHIEDSKTFDLYLEVISFLSRDFKLAPVRDRSGKTPVGFLMAHTDAPPNLLSAIVNSDITGVASNEAKGENSLETPQGNLILSGDNPSPEAVMPATEPTASPTP